MDRRYGCKNKRYGMEVNFDTVNNQFEIKEWERPVRNLVKIAAVGVTANQSASDVSVGRVQVNGGRRERSR